MTRRILLTLASTALGLVALRISTEDPRPRARLTSEEVEARPAPPGIDTWWHVHTPIEWGPIDTLGAGDEPHRRVGVSEVPGLNELNGNLTMPFGPVVFNSLDSWTFHRVEGHRDHDLSVWGFDSRHFGRGMNLALFNQVLVVDRVRVGDAPGSAVFLFGDDRTRVTFERAGGAFRMTQGTGMQLSLSDVFPRGTSTVVDRNGSRYRFEGCDGGPLTVAQALREVADRFGNRVVVERDELCLPTRILETTVDGSETHVTRLAYERQTTDGGAESALRLVRLTIDEGTEDAITFEMAYEGDYYQPRLTEIATRAGSSPDALVTRLHWVESRPSGAVTGHQLHVVEGPILRSQLDACTRTICGAWTRYGFDASGRFRDLQQPNGLGVHVLYATDGTVRVFQSWPFAGHESPDCCASAITTRDGEPYCSAPIPDAEFCPRHHLNVTTLHVEGRDLAAQVVRRVDNFGRWEAFRRDEWGRVVERSRSDGRTWRFAYLPASGPPVQILDPLGRRTRARHDALGRPVMLEPGDGTTVELDYHDEPGPLFGTPRRITTTGADGATEVRSFDATVSADTITVVESVDGRPSGGVVMSGAGRVLRRTDPVGVTQGLSTSGGVTSLYFRDESTGVAGSLGEVRLSETGRRLETIENAHGDVAAVTTDDQGRLSRVEHTTGGIAVELDDAGRVIGGETSFTGDSRSQGSRTRAELSCGEVVAASAEVGRTTATGYERDPTFPCGDPEAPACETDALTERCWSRNTLLNRYRFCENPVPGYECGCHVSEVGDGTGAFRPPTGRRTCLDPGW